MREKRVWAVFLGPMGPCIPHILDESIPVVPKSQPNLDSFAYFQGKGLITRLGSGMWESG